MRLLTAGLAILALAAPIGFAKKTKPLVVPLKTSDGQDAGPRHLLRDQEEQA